MSYDHWEYSNYEDYGRASIQTYWEQSVTIYAPAREVEFTEEDCLFLKSVGATV